MNGYGVGKVVFSRSKKFKVGDWVAGMLGWQTYGAFESSKLTKLPQGYPHPQHFLGVLGISGLTAYMGLKEIGIKLNLYLKIKNKNLLILKKGNQKLVKLSLFQPQQVLLERLPFV
jgi:NADPH:quinone reductase-like Zn-dependent oxidoreductase